ncbi:MAG: GNAT family N-acetyltransferase [Ilumatobacter fluminis]|uniref:GNAT family N-acetyltransferase n=1 Tax=Ilumatobacter fluminis TaxID=467091 RepID=UPI0032EF1EC2
MVTTRIRRSSADDLDTLVGLGREYCAADGHVFDEATVRSGFAGVVADDTYGAVLVAEVEATVVGYAVMSWGWSIEIGGLDVVLDEIYVRPKGRGVGGRLLAAVEALCRDVGAKRVFLETEPGNERARRWYAANGFETQPSIWMSKELG